jgi:hypothetical protein
MRKVLVAVLVMVSWCNVGFAFGKAYKVKLLEENIYGTVFRLTMPSYEKNIYKWNKAFQKKYHCD